MAEVDLEDVSVFARVVEAGSFSGAARALHAPKSSVSRRVARLEGALGTRLLQRTTRSIALTEAGRLYYSRVTLALAEMGAAAEDAAAAREVPSGPVRMTAPPDVGAEVLPPLVAGFVARFPLVRIDVDFSADPRDLVEGGYDLGLRTGRQTDARVAATKLQDIAFRLYASAGYLSAAGAPQQAEDLSDHACVLFRARDGRAQWRLVSDGPGASEVDVAVSGPIAANDMSFVRRAAIAGAGIALLPELVGQRAVATGRLEAVLPHLWSDGIPLYLVYPSSRHVPLRVRAFRDYVLERFPQSALGR